MMASPSLAKREGREAAPAYRFRLSPERFDTHVMTLFDQDKASRHVRDRLIAQVRAGQLDAMLLSRVPGLERLPDALVEKAALNIIDFFFEPIVLPTMPHEQVAGYFRSIYKALRLGEVSGLDSTGSLWIDSVHHACVFSVLYELAAYLADQRGFRQLILLHQGLRPEPRLPLIAAMLQQRHAMRVTYLQLQGRWFAQLSRIATPQALVYYLTDMPRETSPRTAPKERRSAILQLDAPGIALRLDTLSGSGVFARRLGAAHLVLDYPARDAIRLRPYDPAAPVTCCPLEDWIFWPLLDRAAPAE
jgi:hypothetical protein